MSRRKLAKILEMTITYEIDQVSWKLTSKGIWRTGSANVKRKNGKFSEDKVREYVEKYRKADTIHTVCRGNFRTHKWVMSITLAKYLVMAG